MPSNLGTSKLAAAYENGRQRALRNFMGGTKTALFNIHPDNVKALRLLNAGKGALTGAAAIGIPAALLGAAFGEEGHRGESALRAGLGAGLIPGLLGGAAGYHIVPTAPKTGPVHPDHLRWMNGVPRNRKAAEGAVSAHVRNIRTNIPAEYSDAAVDDVLDTFSRMMQHPAMGSAAP